MRSTLAAIAGSNQSWQRFIPIACREGPLSAAYPPAVRALGQPSSRSSRATWMAQRLGNQKIKLSYAARSDSIGAPCRVASTWAKS